MAVQADETVTYEKPRFDPPAGPTPEEISARLEALLKRTHELRRARATPIDDGHPDGGPSWPPSDRDLAAVEVLNVPAAGASGMLSGRPLAGATPGQAPTPTRGEGSARAAHPEPVAEHQDWNTLRLRESPPSAPPARTPTWVWPVIVALVIALGLETAYLLWTAPWSAPAVAVVATPPDDSPGRSPDRLPDGSTDGPRAEAPPVAPAPPAVTTPAATAASTLEAPTATTGAVRIQSDPPGAVVTMEGRERGVTPITIGRLRPGRHDVIVVRPGLGRLELKVDVVAGQTARLDASGRAPGQR